MRDIFKGSNGIYASIINIFIFPGNILDMIIREYFMAFGVNLFCMAEGQGGR
jgi:hypothetical protein